MTLALSLILAVMLIPYLPGVAIIMLSNRNSHILMKPILDIVFIYYLL